MGFGIKTRLLHYSHLVFRYRLSALRWRLFGDTSQHGEYSVLRKLIGPTTPRIVVEVGANNGVRHSNSYPFIRQGWDGILIEPNPVVFEELRERYSGNDRVQTVNCACGQTPGILPLHLGRDGDLGEFATLAPEPNHCVSKPTFQVQVRTLTDVLELVRCPQGIGILSVDTEGFDFQVFAGLDWGKFQPSLIVTEDQSPDDSQKHALLRAQGYEPRSRRGCNSIWMRSNR
jgi:FkbM family methyltransferase